MVWIYDEEGQDRWRISHQEIYDDLELKLTSNAPLGSALVDLLRAVCEGSEPAQLTSEPSLAAFSSLPGLPAELILKSYKWIWGQEDCNYPTGEGRWMSMTPILKLRAKIVGGST